MPLSRRCVSRASSAVRGGSASGDPRDTSRRRCASIGHGAPRRVHGANTCAAPARASRRAAREGSRVVSRSAGSTMITPPSAYDGGKHALNERDARLAARAR